MKRCSVLIALRVAFNLNALGQVDYGTVIIVGVSKDKVIIAADSRDLHGKDALGREVYDDRQCKLAALGGKVLYGATGLVVDYAQVLPHGLHVDAKEEARKAFLIAPKRMKMFESLSAFCSPPSCDPKTFPDQTFVESVADEWKTELTSAFIQSSLFELERWLSEFSPKTREIGITGIFARISPTNEIQVFVERIACKEWKATSKGDDHIPCDFIDGGASIPPTLELHWYPFGITDTATEYINQMTPRAVAEVKQWKTMKDWEIAIRLVDLTIAFSSESEHVHGPIDVVELDRNGKVSWKQNPQNCPEDH